MRIWLRPDKLAEEVRADARRCLRRNPGAEPAVCPGSFGAEPSDGTQAYTFSVSTKGRLVTPEAVRQHHPAF
jgi:HAE1 family hydrophobic/amphiphilic exporter-1/multidrug efflux pump